MEHSSKPDAMKFDKRREARDAANRDKKKQATKRFDFFMSKYADNFTTDHPDKPGIASGKFNSEYTFDKLIYEDCCNSDLLSVFFQLCGV